MEKELQLYFPKLFDDATVKVLRPIEATHDVNVGCDNKGDESDKREEIDHITTLLLTYTKPKSFSGSDSVEIQYD